MLLPSPIDYDVSRKPPKYPTRSIFPPFSLSPATSTSGQSLTNVYSSCKALQMILRSSETLNDQNSWQLSSSSCTRSSLSSKRRLCTRSKSSDCSHRDNIKSRLKQGKCSMQLHSLAKRINLSTKKETCSNHSKSKAREENISSSDNGDSERKARVNSSIPKRHRIAHILFPKKPERSTSIHSRLQENCKQEISNLLVSSTPDIDEKKVEWSAEEDQFMAKLAHQKLKFLKIDWHNCTRSMDHQLHSKRNRLSSLSCQVKSVLKEIKEEIT